MGFPVFWILSIASYLLRRVTSLFPSPMLPLRYLHMLITCPWAFSASGWRVTALSDSPHMADASLSLSSLWTFVRLAPVHPYLFCTGELLSLPVLSRGKESPPLASTTLSCAAHVGFPMLALFATRAHCWLMFNLLSTKLYKSFSVELLSSLSWCMGLSTRRCPDLCISPAEFHKAHVGPVLQSVQVPLNGSTAIWCANHSSQFCTICTFAEGALCPIFHIANKDVKQHWPQYQHPGYTTSDWSQAGLSAADNSALSLAVLPGFNPPHCLFSLCFVSLTKNCQ